MPSARVRPAHAARSQKLLAGSLWSGTGTTALEVTGRSDVDLLFVCESDEARRDVLRSTFPSRNVRVFEDATKLDEHMEIVSRCHMLFGEFPCPDCSQMGELGGARDGLRGDRSGTVIGMLAALGKFAAGGYQPPLLIFARECARPAHP